MGYNTRFTLKAVDHSGQIAKLPSIGKLGGYVWEVLQNVATPDDETRWYEHKRDMLALSKQHPFTIFVLDGEGEEQGDVWRMFFLDGRSHTWKQPVVEPPELSAEIFEAIGGTVMR